MDGYCRRPRFVVGHGIEPKSAQSPKLSRCSGAMKPAAMFSSTADASAPPAWAAEPSPLRPKMTLRRGVFVVLGRAQCQTAWSILRAQPPPLNSVPHAGSSCPNAPARRGD